MDKVEKLLRAGDLNAFPREFWSDEAKAALSKKDRKALRELQVLYQLLRPIPTDSEMRLQRQHSHAERNELRLAGAFEHGKAKGDIKRATLGIKLDYTGEVIKRHYNKTTTFAYDIDVSYALLGPNKEVYGGMDFRVLAPSPTIDTRKGPPPNLVKQARHEEIPVVPEKYVTNILEIELDFVIANVKGAGYELLSRLIAWLKTKRKDFDFIFFKTDVTTPEGEKFVKVVETALSSLVGRKNFVSAEELPSYLILIDPNKWGR